jgi:hypothetical protein
MALATGRSPLLAVALTALAVLAGCSGGLPGVSGPGDPGGTIGEEGGYAATDPLAVTTADGLNETEREAVVARTMARVEVIRGLEFTDEVDVRVVSRQEYRDGGAFDGGDYDPWDEQVWEGTFIVGENRTVNDAFRSVYGSSVLGFYAGGEIVLVSDDPTPKVDTRVLAHELVHALQDQRLALSAGATTQDGRLAASGLIEGDANYVEARYGERCGTEWDCLDRPARGAGSRPAGFSEGVYRTIIQPYVAGPGFVDALHERGGWTAVDDAYDRFPASTEQVIHPERYPDDEPVSVEVPDRSGDGWERFDREQEGDTLGEASIFAMFATNGLTEDNGLASGYDDPLSDGWAGDRLVPYHPGDENGTGAYVWQTEWESPAEAREFREGYERLLARLGATGDGPVYVVPSGGFADAFRVTQDGSTVTIVNAPTRAALEEVHGPGPGASAS